MAAHDDLLLLGLVRISNAWLFRDPDGRRFLVDTGHAVERFALDLALRRAGARRPGDLAAVLLTHRHSDHAGNAAWIRARFGCPVFCHEADAPLLTSGESPPRLAGRGAPLVHDVLCRIEDRYPARTPIDGVYREGSWRHGFEVIEVPGHTEGSVLLHHGPTGVLFTGDALLTGPPAQRFLVRLRLAVPAYSADAERCRRSVLAYLARRPRVTAIGPGHGPLVRSRVAERLEALSARGVD